MNELKRENEVKQMIDKTDIKIQNSVGLYQKNLDEKVNLAKQVNDKLDKASRRAQIVIEKRENKKKK